MPRLLALTCLLLLSAVSRAGGLFDAGAWAPIVLPASPEVEEWRAANTLADWCQRVTGVRPEIIYEWSERPRPDALIFVGQTAAAKAAGVRAPEGEGDTARRAVIGSAVYLVGNNPTATRIAVGRFCEQHLGVFFAFPGEQGADWTPRRQVGFPAPDEFRPDFRWRQLSGLNTVSEEWACSVGFGRVPEFSHGLYRIFDRKLWAEDPTFFPVVAGVRQEPGKDGTGPNPRLDHPRAASIGAKYAREYFRLNPTAFSVPFGINDSYLFDDAVASEGWYRDRPVRTDYVFGFLNAVADSVWAPDGDYQGERHAIGALAYMQTLRAPKIPVRPAIFPWVCADRTAYGDPAFAAQDRANVAAWAKSGARRVGVYDYPYGSLVASPRVNFTALIQSIRATHTAGARGWYAEAYPLWAFDAPKLWLAAKLLEDKAAHTPALLETWFARAYGPAATPMLGAFAQIEAAWKRDALVGGKDQFLRHFQDQRGALVLSDREIAAIEVSLRAAQDALRSAPGSTMEATARLARQSARLRQFVEAWELYRAYRLAVQSRRVTPAYAERLAALRHLTAAEADFASREAAFNRAWGSYGWPVSWSQFPAENPRAQWSERVLSEGRSPRLEAWARADGDKGWLAYRVAQSATTAPIAHKHDFADAARPAASELAPMRTNLVERIPAGLRVIAPAGKLGPIAVDAPLQPGRMVRLQLWTWAERLGVSESQAILRLRFIGPGRQAETSVVCQPRQTVLPGLVPAWATRMEYELSFTGGVFAQEATVQFADLPASSR